ncbi:CBO0543 family protein [Paenibacillus agricola]|uniref:Permease n=1 Tax=Paenibacillus agricola TaxID=2716264 RepID=A0ABX0J5R2_9BACL|nr:CBO0543 family protein [Paenibacillus agricola]NHN31747.1 hypothetical protein [Paenibacillus agricola]
MQEIDQLNQRANTMEMEWWLTHDLFSLQWWIIVIVNLAFIGLLLFFIDRNRTMTILLAFLVGFSLVGFVDQTGKFFRFWSYPHQFLPFSENFNAVDFFAIPIMFTLIYQRFGTWRAYLIAAVVFSLLSSYIGEPIFVFLDIYKLDNWTYTKSFFALCVMSVFLKAMVDWMVGKREQVHTDTDHKVAFSFFKSKQKV